MRAVGGSCGIVQIAAADEEGPAEGDEDFEAPEAAGFAEEEEAAGAAWP